MPAILKNFIDNNITSGFAFKYVEGKNMPLKLLKGKSMRIFATEDGPWYLYAMIKPMQLFIYSKVTFGLCGIKIKSFDIFTRMFLKRNDKERQRMLDLVSRRARK